MQAVGRVKELWRHPVKSLRGERCQALEVNPRGAVGDRAYAVRTAEGKLGSGKSTRRFRRVDGLLELGAVIEGTTPTVVLPDGRRLRVGEPETDAALSEWLGQRVALAREEAVPHLDAAPVHLLTTASLAWLQRGLPDAAIVAERFRPNVVVDLPGEGLFEHGWVGRRLRLGRELELRIVSTTERCRMVGLAQEDLGADSSILEHLARNTRAAFGVYAQVLRTGRVEPGDAVEITEDA